LDIFNVMTNIGCGKKGTDTFSASTSVGIATARGGGKGCLSPFFRILVHFADWLYGCSHSKTTFPITLQAETYIVCLERGSRLAYDWTAMHRVPALALNGIRSHG